MVAEVVVVDIMAEAEEVGMEMVLVVEEVLVILVHR
jgi:hypothetical protein